MISLTQCFLAQLFLMVSSATMPNARPVPSLLPAGAGNDSSHGRYINDSTRTCVRCSQQFPVGYNYCPFDGMQLPPAILIDYETPPGDFVAYEKEPVVVKKVDPKYPPLALAEGLEGRVVVKLWVGRDGKVKQVVILKSDDEIFNNSAIEAAKQFEFVPAYMLGKPVPVWVAFPFRYYVKDQKDK